MEPLVPVPYATLVAARDQLASDLQRIDAGEIPGFTSTQVGMLRARLAELDDVIRKHQASRH